MLLFGAVVSSFYMTCGWGAQNNMVAVRPGHNAMYVGSHPYEEYAWIKIVVASTERTAINLSMTFDYRSNHGMTETNYWADHPLPRVLDVANGTNNIFLFFIPANLNVNDSISVPRNYPDLKVGGTELREYAGAQRTVVFASYWNTSAVLTALGGDGTIYWDRETGLLVEIVAMAAGTPLTSIKLFETNIWGIEAFRLMTSSSTLLVFAAALVAVPASLLPIFLRARKEPVFRISHPYVGIALVGIGVAFTIAGLLYLSAFNQVVSFFYFALGLGTVVTGVLIYTGIWAYWDENKLRIDIGNVLLALAVVILGLTALCAMYRELGALVPYDEIASNWRYGTENFGSHARRSLVMEGVFYYPYTWLVSPLASIAVPVLFFGFFYKMRHRY